MFVSFTFITLTLDERKTLTKILTCKTSHNHSPNQHMLRTRRNKETGKFWHFATVGLISFTISINIQLGAIQNIAFNSTVESNTNFNTIFKLTWHHNWHSSSLTKMVDIIWDAIIWQHPFLTSGQHELDIWNSIQKNIVNDLSTCITVIQLYTRNTGLSNCILGIGNLTWYVHVPVKYELFWKITSIKNAISKFVLLVGTFGIFVK